ncbi:MAG TPA: AsmA-like C-terminal region-containing protein [Geminicoccaceae bacterium]|nr:AsmA-like C-terminal region-containing protein [Geminicoccaceae bacterium]
MSAAAETLRAADADLRLAVDTFEAEAVPVVRGFAGHLRVDGGQLVAEEVRLDLPEGPITGTIRADASGGAGDAIPVSIVASAGESTVRAEGTLTEETSLDAFTLELDGEGRNLATLNVAVHPFADWSLPETPPYRVEGTLVHEGGDWALDDFRIAMGRSDLVGTLRYRGADGEGRPLVTGSLTSTTLDLPEVLVVAGLRSPVEEEVEEEEVAGEIVEEAAQMDEAEDAAEAEEEGGGEPVLPDPSLQLAFLREFDAEIDYRSGEVRAPQFPVQNLALSLRLEGGVLTVDPLEMEGGGGRLTAPFVLNAGADPTEIELDARLRGFDTRHIMVLFGEQAQEVAEGGRVSGRVAAKARGNTLREALGAATGDVAVIMEGGWISSLVIEVFGFDLGEALAVWFTAEDEEDEGEVADGGEAEGGEGDEETDKVAVRCLVGDFNLQGGVLAAETLVLDTTDTNIVGRGTIDLGSETLDLTLEPNAKDASVLTAQTPIHIQGTFGDVEINPDRESLMARGAAAVGLGVLIPVIGAVIPFIEPGLGEDSDCRGLIADAETRVDEGAGQGGAAQ